MIGRQHWVTSALILTWVGGALLSSIAVASANEAGKKVYQKSCQSCHGPDGLGNPKLEKTLRVPIPPVTGTALAQKDDAEMIRIIAEGQGKMPGYAKKLSAEEQQQVLAYMKTLGPQ